MGLLLSRIWKSKKEKEKVRMRNGDCSYGSTLTKCLASVENCILDETYEKGNMKAQAGDGHR